jgi:hypothetical protein
MVPVAAVPPITPFTDHVNVAVVKDGVNCWVPPARTFAVLGDMVKAPGPGPVLPGGVSAQLEIIKARTTITGARIDERRTVPSQVYLDSEWTQTQSM